MGTNAIFDERSYTWDGANNKTQRVEKVGGVAVKTYDYAYDALNRLERSTKTLASAAPGTAGNWTGAMTLTEADPAATTFAGGDALALSGTFSATFDPGTLQVFVSEVPGVRDVSSDYPATLQGYTGSQIDALAPALPHHGTFELYSSALDGATRGYSNPVSITYGPQVREYGKEGRFRALGRCTRLCVKVLTPEFDTATIVRSLGIHARGKGGDGDWGALAVVWILAWWSAWLTDCGDTRLIRVALWHWRGPCLGHECPSS